MAKRLAPLFNRFAASINFLAHNPQIHNRLEIGSAIALGSGLLVTILFFLGILEPLQLPTASILFDPSPGRGFVKQDFVAQVVIVFLLALLAGATLPHFPFLSSLALAIIYFVIYLGYAINKYDGGTLVQPLYPALALFLTLMGTTITRFVSEDRPRAAINRLFRRYNAPEKVERIVSLFQRGNLSLAGNRRLITALCVDLRDFEPLADSLPADELIQRVGEGVKIISTIVFRHEGTLIHRTGSAILATWNLPLEQANYARVAARAATDIREQMRGFARAKNLDVRVGVGLTTGWVTAGIIAKSGQAEYSVVGQTITFAERLAGKSRRGIYVDAATFKEIGKEYDARVTAPLRLRAKGEPLPVWRIVETVDSDEEVEETREEQ